jgi:isopenicillin-N N-acyltransferase-like protein
VFPILDVAGTAFERGREHGLKARTRVELSIANYARLFEACGLGWHGAQRLSRPYARVIEDFGGDLYEEICGIAAGSGRTTDEILALNCRTELLPPTFLQRPSDAWLASRLADADFGECSALAVRPDASATGGTLLAQNWDWLGCQRDALLLLRGAGTDGCAYLTLTEAGMLAKIGCNEGGFGVCLNILRSEDDGAACGVPVHVLLRALLDCRSVQDAIARLGDASFGASSSILCADVQGDRAAFELTPAGLHLLRGEGAAFCHTNHFLAEASAGLRPMPPPLSSIPRLERMQSLVSAHERLGVADVQAILRDETQGYRSISRTPDPAEPPFARLETVTSVVMDLAARVMHVAADIPSRTEYRPVSLRSAA